MLSTTLSIPAACIPSYNIGIGTAGCFLNAAGSLSITYRRGQMNTNSQFRELDGRQTQLLDPELRRREDENRSYMMHLETGFYC